MTLREIYTAEARRELRRYDRAPLPVAERWKAAVAERTARGLSRYQAMQAIGKELPDLWKEYSAASKPPRRR